jgi:exodeoxyribonuclease VII large subunit
VGIITSEDAAAFTDVARICKNRWPIAELLLVPSQVQGHPAIKQLLQAFDVMEHSVKPDVIILTRGGGSLEDLQAFNSEDLARRIFSCAIPVVCGVGHERDWTIADFVADVRAATPSNAAELATPNRKDILLHITALEDGMRYRIQTMFQNRLRALSHSMQVLSSSMRFHMERFSEIAHRLEVFGKGIADQISRNQERTVLYEGRIRDWMTRRQKIIVDRISSLHSRLVNLSPKAVLRRGYSITRVGKRLVRSSSDVSKHDILTTSVADGDIISEVQ